MRNYTKDILKLVVLEVLLLLSLQLSAEGKPPKSGCLQRSHIELYYPTDPGAENTCVPCPECPEGQGLTPQCGSKVPNYTKIECIQCQANVSYSSSHGIESCKACQDCDLKNVIQHCSPDKNRICGTKCPQGYFLDDNQICQECYFCCGNVSEAQRRQRCKDIGMSRDWQCEKTRQNQRCYEDLKKVTTLPSTKSTADTAPHDHNTMTKKHSQLQVHDTANNIANLTTKSFTGSKSTQHGSTPIPSHEGKVTMSPTNDDSRSAIPETKRENGQEKHVAANVGPVMGGVVSIVVIISAFVLVASRKGIKEYFSRTNNSEAADSMELAPLSISEPTDSGRTSPHDHLTNEEFAEEIEEPNIEEPNTENIPADCRVSEIEQLCDHNGEPMLFYVQRKLDVPGTPDRKTWRSIGRVMKVSSDDLDLIEAAYKADRSPTEALLAKFKTFTPEPTMKEFVQALIICQRNNVASYICNWQWEGLFKSVQNESSYEMVHQPAS